MDGSSGLISDRKDDSSAGSVRGRVVAGFRSACTDTDRLSEKYIARGNKLSTDA